MTVALASPGHRPQQSWQGQVPAPLSCHPVKTKRPPPAQGQPYPAAVGRQSPHPASAAPHLELQLGVPQLAWTGHGRKRASSKPARWAALPAPLPNPIPRPPPRPPSSWDSVLTKQVIIP